MSLHITLQYYIYILLQQLSLNQLVKALGWLAGNANNRLQEISV
jgi:hypothetical protein